MRIIALPLLLLAIILEGTFVALPLVLSVLVVLQIIYKSGWVLFLAFVSGFLLDIMLFRELGQTSLYLLFFLTLLILYERRFEVQTFFFLFVAILVGTVSYLVIFGSSAFFWQLGSSVIFAFLLFPFFVRSRHEMIQYTRQ